MKIPKHTSEYRQVIESRLLGKGILFEPILDSDQVAELKQRWLANFAIGVNTNDIYIDQFMWHIFSYERQACIEGEEAISAFTIQNKDDCYVLFQHFNDAYVLKNASSLSHDDIIADIDFHSSDIFVVNKSFDWTYVYTHDICCGPYYYHKVQKTTPG